MIYFTPNTTTGIWRVPETGGAAEQITQLSGNERSHRWPHFLPGGRGLLMTAQDKGTDFNETNIELLDLQTNERRVLHRGGSFPSYISTGHLLFAREGTIYAVPFDLDSGDVKGAPAPVLEGVETDLRNGGGHFAFSQTGVMVYRIGGQVSEDTSVVWVDRAGETIQLIEKLANFNSPRLSPDGTQLAVGIWESASSVNNIWTYDTQRGTLSRLTFSEDVDFSPVWSPDGTKIYFSSTRNDSIPNIYVKPADGSGTAERVTNSQDAQIVSDVSPDGKTILFHQESTSTDTDLMAVDLVGEGNSRILLQTPFKERLATVSPDGNWIAYESNESTAREIYVRPFGHTVGKWQISTDGGRDPLWSPNGKELFFRMDDTIMAVPVEADGSSLRAGAPAPLFKLNWGGLGFDMHFDIAPDGERFVALKQDSPKEKIDRTHLRFVFGWFDEVASRVPTH